MAKRKLFNPLNVVTTIKAWIILFLLQLVTVFVWLLLHPVRPAIAIVLIVLWGIFTLFLYGYLANIWWKWK